MSKDFVGGDVLIILVVIMVGRCDAVKQGKDGDICRGSSCGSIANISYPFRLRTDPQQCGNPIFELDCENNVTAVYYLNSVHKYRVKAIDYDYYTVTLVDASIENDDVCSFPTSSLSGYLPWGYNYFFAWPINIIRCPNPLNNSSGFLPTNCANSRGHTYFQVGDMRVVDFPFSCTLDGIGFTSWNFSSESPSLSEIHHSLLYGFQFLWFGSRNCRYCNGDWNCPSDNKGVPTCRHGLRAKLEAAWDNIKWSPKGPGGSGPFEAFILLLLLILAVFFAGVSLAARIIFGFIIVWAFINIESNWYFDSYWPISRRYLLIGLFFSARFIIVFPIVLWFFIHKFRTRHLSRFNAIENFLQSDNRLMPIRYSYGDIKKMTRGFRDKLGQGGYGSVYKGKLRSGYDVAVKLLKNSRGNDKDFMNEIATIGRIHHVNVVNLVGYCAERSKRVLIFDYMTNGSLDKYIFTRETTNYLSWEKKYEIAIGVARGIKYLHQGCDIQILHFDIKPHNILLDHSFTPKIADFGLAKFYSTEKNRVTMTAVKGTIGYVAPELINRGIGEVSYKADVYSFGMLLIEMVGLNRDFRGDNQTSTKYFPCWIYDHFDQDKDIEFGNIDEGYNDIDREIAKKMTIVALWCIQISPSDRPSMNEVVKMLEGQVEHLRLPSRQPQSAQVAIYDEDQNWSTFTTDSIPLLCEDNIEITVEDYKV